jgi:hypothetical protein
MKIIQKIRQGIPGEQGFKELQKTIIMGAAHVLRKLI